LLKKEGRKKSHWKREREREGKCGLCAVCVVLELGFKRCFQPLFSTPRWPSFVMRNVDFSLTEKEGRKKREKGSLREREREREREEENGGIAPCV